MTRALHEATAYLTDAINRYPAAARNLHGERTPSSAGLLDGGCQAGYPTGHSGTARIDCTHDTIAQARTCRRCGLNPDPARAAIRQLDRDLTAIIQLCANLLDIDIKRQAA